MPRYEIQSLVNDAWTNDAALLGQGLDQQANTFETETAAATAMAELLELWPDASLRVAAIEE